MVYVLLVGGFALVLGVALVARRRVAASAWDRELDRAFAVAERREMTRRVL